MKPIRGGSSWHAAFREDFDGICRSNAVGSRIKALVATVMFMGWLDEETFNAAIGPGSANIFTLMHHYFGSQGGKWHPVKVMRSKNKGVCRMFWFDGAPAEHVKLHYSTIN